MSEIQSLARGLKIVNLLNKTSNEISVTEIAGHLGVDKGSASRLLMTLAVYGFVEKNEITRRYQLRTVVGLSHDVLVRLPLREAAKPFLRQLIETAVVRTWQWRRREKRFTLMGRSPATLRVNAQVGTMNPLRFLHFAGQGTSGLRSLRDSRNAGSLHLSHDHRPGSIGDAPLSLCARQAMLDNEEFDLGVRCIAAPVFDYRDRWSAASAFPAR